MFKRFTLLIVILGFLSILPATAQWTRDTSLNTPICTRPGNIGEPRLVSDGAGGAIVVFEDREGHILPESIVAQRVNSVGVLCWPRSGVLISPRTVEARFPELISDGQHGAIITWTDERNGSMQIYAQRVDTAGTPLWQAGGVLVSAGTGDYGPARIVSDGDGGVILSYHGYPDGYIDSLTYSDIYAQRLNANGQAQWTAGGVLVCSAPADQNYDHLTSDGQGGAIIAWSDERLWLLNGYDVYAQWIGSDGVPRWKSDGVAICRADEDQLLWGMVSDGAGGAILCWMDERLGIYEVYAQRVDSSGTVRWNVDGVAVGAALGGRHVFPRLIVDGSGGAIIVWVKRDLYDEGDILAQRVSADGIELWAAGGEVVADAPDEQRVPVLVDDGIGGAVISWVDGAFGESDIYAQRVDHTGAMLWSEGGIAVSSATYSQWEPVNLIRSSVSTFIMVWEDWREGFYADYDVFAQLVNLDGTPGPPLSVSLSCTPASGTLPLNTQFTVSMQHLRAGLNRRIAARIELHLARAGKFKWRSGYTNLDDGETFTESWPVILPALFSLVGDNTFRLVVEDVTPAPYNQPPYPPSGDMSWDFCKVTGIEP